MKATKYHKKSFQHWLLKAAVLFSVFSFSGFNIQAQTKLRQTTETELVDSKIETSVFKLVTQHNKCIKGSTIKAITIDYSFNSPALMIYNAVLKTIFKHHQSNILLAKFDAFKFFINGKCLYSKDDLPPHFIS